MFLHFCDSKFENEHHKDTKLQIFVVEANTKNYKGTVVAKRYTDRTALTSLTS